ncbi:MAG: hypothetical protein QE509_10275 [Gammaproteobacteria bacterium]|nr:hypothetical protein [Gammaproteobacteria bacterium]
MSKHTLAAGAWQPKNSSNSSEGLAASVFASRRTEILTLALIGALVVVMHESVNLPLKLPGHHGLEWMALLMFGRTISRETNAATLVALGAAATASAPLWPQHGSLLGLSYLLTGLAVDALYRLFKRPGAVSLGVIAALAHTVKPLWKLAAVNGLGLQFGSITAGAGFAVLCHLGFGLVGGVAGAIAGLALRERLTRRQG